MIKTIIYADSPIHAKLLGEWNYGFGTVISNPTRLAETTIAPKTPEQARIQQLKQQLDTAKQQAQLKKINQQQQKLNQRRSNLQKKKPAP